MSKKCWLCGMIRNWNHSLHSLHAIFYINFLLWRHLHAYSTRKFAMYSTRRKLSWRTELIYSTTLVWTKKIYPCVLRGRKVTRPQSSLKVCRWQFQVFSWQIHAFMHLQFFLSFCTTVGKFSIFSTVGKCRMFDSHRLNTFVLLRFYSSPDLLKFEN